MQNNPAPSASDHPPDFHGGRVLIPRLERPVPPVPVEKRRRVAKACSNCRKRKTKCTGGQPRCHECEANDLTCVYEQHRKDRLREVSEQKQLLVAVLKNLHLSVNSSDQKRIEDALEEVGAKFASTIHNPDIRYKPSQINKSRLSRPSDCSLQVDEELPSTQASSGAALAPSAAAPAPSTSAPPVLERASQSTTPTEPQTQNSVLEDANQSSSAEPESSLGYSSTFQNPSSLAADAGELDWLQHLQLDLVSTHDDSSPTKPPTDASFYLNNDGFDVDDTVDVNELPPRNIALRLYQNYTKTVHDWLPILPTAFEDQFNMYYDRPYPVPDKWLAILNLVFAIGARYSRLTKENEASNDVVFFSRAVQLLRGNDKEPISSAPDLPLVQALALLSLYHLAAGQADKAWTTIGMSVRSALAIGLHLQYNTPTSLIRKETSTRTWWSLHLLECLTSCITARPCTVPFDDCNVSLPQTLQEEESRNRIVPLLRAQIQISFIAHRALGTLHSVRASITPWDRIQTAVTRLLAELEKRLPDMTLFPSNRERKLLHFTILSTKLTITRPCLCPRPPQGSGHDGTPAVDAQLAEVCVQSALDLANLLPDEPDKSVYQDVPWWCLVHYLMQAMAVLLLEMSRGGSQSISRAQQIATVKKLVRWLRLMRTTDVAADRAVRVVINVLRNSHSQGDIADLLEEEAAGVYSQSLSVSGTWHGDVGPAYPQLLPEFSGPQLGLDIDLGLLPGPLPPPPLYGDPFLTNFDETTSWEW